MKKTKSKQFVSQYLENIDRAVLENYQAIIKKYVKNRHGIYALFDKKGNLYYVGLASELKTRLKNHLTDSHASNWKTFSIFITIEEEHLKELEALLLHIFNPKGNTQTAKFTKAENLDKDFKNKMKQHYENDLKKLMPGKICRKVKDNKSLIKTKDRKPLLAKYINKTTKIILLYKGNQYNAIINSQGFIKMNGKIYKSPSAAAKDVLKKSANGWYWWTFERAPGDWVRLDELRK